MFRLSPVNSSITYDFPGGNTYVTCGRTALTCVKHEGRRASVNVERFHLFTFTRAVHMLVLGISSLVISFLFAHYCRKCVCTYVRGPIAAGAIRAPRGCQAVDPYEARSHNRGRRPQARGPRKTIEKDKCAIFSENCATLNVINSRGYTHICVGLGDSLRARLRLDSKTRHMLSTKALINPSK